MSAMIVGAVVLICGGVLCVRGIDRFSFAPFVTGLVMLMLGAAIFAGVLVARLDVVVRVVDAVELAP